jgi:hypothetical protein
MQLSLEYPNGRTARVDYDGPLQTEIGQEFELYGRRWRVIAHKRPRHAPENVEPVVVCKLLTASPNGD